MQHSGTAATWGVDVGGRIADPSHPPPPMEEVIAPGALKQLQPSLAYIIQDQHKHPSGSVVMSCVLRTIFKLGCRQRRCG